MNFRNLLKLIAIGMLAQILATGLLHQTINFNVNGSWLTNFAIFHLFYTFLDNAFHVPTLEEIFSKTQTD